MYPACNHQFPGALAPSVKGLAYVGRDVVLKAEVEAKLRRVSPIEL